MGLRKADYERVRSDSRRFVIIQGHELPDVETVIERNGSWAIIEKAPEVTDIVDALDARRDGLSLPGLVARFESRIAGRRGVSPPFPFLGGAGWSDLRISNVPLTLPS